MLSHTSTLHNIISKHPAVFQQRLSANWWKRNAACHSDYGQTSKRMLAPMLGFELTIPRLPARVDTDWATGIRHICNRRLWNNCSVYLEINLQQLTLKNLGTIIENLVSMFVFVCMVLYAAFGKLSMFVSVCTVLYAGFSNLSMFVWCYTLVSATFQCLCLFVWWYTLLSATFQCFVFVCIVL